ncbi:unnamed protein product [Linum trigynum]|uniref:Uncharacterized protein n=1 Tax=Linum trigynum TaxID=586398 RepID=A0AAV2FN21_9ROSI
MILFMSCAKIPAPNCDLCFPEWVLYIVNLGNSITLRCCRKRRRKRRERFGGRKLHLRGTHFLLYQSAHLYLTGLLCNSPVGLSVGLAVGQSSVADEISKLIKRPQFEAGICYDPDDLSQELESFGRNELRWSTSAMW